MKEAMAARSVAQEPIGVEMSQQSAIREQYIEWLRRSAAQRRPLAEERLARAWRKRMERPL